MSATLAQSSIEYSVTFPDANKHYARITMSVNASKGEKVIVKMPVWTPGSYKVREFSQHVDRTSYTSNGTELKPERVDKNTWLCVSNAKGRLSFTYNLYAFDFGVRTSYVDQYKAFLHGPSAFMYFEGMENDDIQIRFSPLESWKNVEMPLPAIEGKPHTFVCKGYDLLADSPVALGTFDIGTYETAGVPHKVVMIGTGNYDLKQVTADIKKVTDEEVKMFNGKHPCERYIHFIQNVDEGGGGLEHLNCHTSQVNRWAYSNKDKYRSFLGLVAHEYFHLWNVKRIRPIELGPFDYNTENYTEMLWIAEGITSYCDDLFMRRCGIHTEESYISALTGNINRLENQPGKDVMTLAESSKLAWVKAYLSNENSNNVTISYYNKGMLVAWMLDVEILSSTNGAKRIDNVMQTLLETYHEKKGRGFTYDEFVGVCSDVCGKDLSDFFNTYIYTLAPIPYNVYMEKLGLSMTDTKSDKISMGLSTTTSGGKTTISYIHPNGPAAKGGLSVNDELIAFDEWRIHNGATDDINRLEPGTEIEVLYSRDGRIYKANVTPETDPSFHYSVVKSEEASETQDSLYKTWIN